MKQLNHPLVSIITPGWNGKAFVHNLLDSLLAQSYDNMEYIYVDDGSTDGTKDTVLAYQDKFEARGIPFKYVYKENGGLCSALQEGLKHVRGELLCWPEYDDILLPTAMEKRVAYLENHPDCAAVTCDAWITPADDLEHPTDVLSFNNPNRFDRNHFVQLLTGNSIFTAACHMVRMDAFDETHPNRQIYQSRIGAIWQMLLPVYYKYNRGFIDEPLVKWVVRSDSVSNERYSEEKRIKADEEFLTIRLNVLESITMPEEDKRRYIEVAKRDSADASIKNGLLYHSRTMFYRGYNYYAENHLQITKDIRFAKWQIDHASVYYAVKCCQFVQKSIFKLSQRVYHAFYPTSLRPNA